MFKKVGRLLAVVFFVLGSIHVYWALGGRWGMAIFEGVADPPAWAALLVAAALFAAMLIILGRIGFGAGRIPSWIFRWGTGVLAAVFLVRGIAGYLEVTTNMEYELWDAWLFSPLCLSISAGCLFMLCCPCKKV